MYFGVNEFEVGVNDGIFSGNEMQKEYVFIMFTWSSMSYFLLR